MRKCRVHYRVYKHRDNKGKMTWFISSRPVYNHPFESYFPRLTHRNRRYASKFITRVTRGPGTYGIFRRYGSKLGKCYYVGQSVNVKSRVAQHIQKVRIAKNKSHGWREIPSMYFDLAEVGLENLKFVKLMSIDSRTLKKMTFDEELESLTIMEQYGMDCFKPSLNVICAEATDMSHFITVTNPIISDTTLKE